MRSSLPTAFLVGLIVGFFLAIYAKGSIDSDRVRLGFMSTSEGFYRLEKIEPHEPHPSPGS